MQILAISCYAQITCYCKFAAIFFIFSLRSFGGVDPCFQPAYVVWGVWNVVDGLI